MGNFQDMRRQLKRRQTATPLEQQLTDQAPQEATKTLLEHVTSEIEQAKGNPSRVLQVVKQFRVKADRLSKAVAAGTTATGSTPRKPLAGARPHGGARVTPVQAQPNKSEPDDRQDAQEDE